jgi:hypothetical protein
MKTQVLTSASTQTVKIPPYAIQTGTEACSGSREGVLISFAKAEPPQVLKDNPKGL